MFLKQNLIVAYILIETIHMSAAMTLGRSDSPVILKVDTNQVIKTLKTVMGSEFMQQMADNIAAKAVKHFINNMNNQKNNQNIFKKVPERVDDQIEQQVSEALERGKLDPKEENKEIVTTSKPKKKKRLLDEQVAMALLRDPSPDGDNLGLDSLENPVTVPAKPMKINGIYMRRKFDEEYYNAPSRTRDIDNYGHYGDYDKVVTV